MVRTGGKDGAVYRCKSSQLQTGHCFNSINCNFVDDMIEATLISGLVDGEFADLLSPDADAQATLTKLRVERTKLTTKADELSEALEDADGVLEIKALAGALKKLDAERKTLTEQIEAIESTNPARELFEWVAGPGADPNTTTLSQLAVLAAWQELDVSQQRAVVRALLDVKVLTGKGDKPGTRGLRGHQRVKVTKKVKLT